ncbi:MAG TPA: hypothetical protein VG872_03620 [Acidimicrobiia bacterium]|jgi:hypothetical protein|nr:hypothetical protein [Acidimicrobiia bacterium]
MPSWKLIAAWVVVVAVTTVLAWQIVSLADSQVSAAPVEIVTPSATGASEPTTTTTDNPTSTSTTISMTPTTGSPSTTSSTSSTSAPPSTTAEWSVRTVTSVGGTVIVRHRAGEVELVAATPLPGFVMEIDDSGPDRVRVEFDNGDVDVRVEIRPSGSGLDVQID